MLENKYYDNKMMLLILIMPLTLFSKWFQFAVLPGKYFWDSQRMLSMLNGDNGMPAWEGSYRVTVDFFDAINIFNFTTLEEFAYALAFIFSFALIFMFSRLPNLTFIQTVYYFATVGLLNIYIFNLSKDIIQFGIFFMMYVVILQNKLPNILKLIIVFLLFFWESTFFRSYYIIMGALFVAIYFLLNCIIKRFRVRKIGHVLLVFFMMIGTLLVLVFLTQFIMPEEYNELIYVRNSNLNEGAVSQIENIIPIDGTFVNFSINYVINAIRMMFPIELIRAGVFYLPFFLFQAFTLYYLVCSIRDLNNKITQQKILAISIFVAYLLTSFIFEPDFGSFVRHEAATFPILHLLVFNSVTQRGEKYES